MNRFSRMAGGLADWLLYTPDGVCPICRRVLFFTDDWLCASCRSQLSHNSGETCVRCGASLRNGEDSVCVSCSGLDGSEMLSGGFIWLRYKSGCGAIVRRIKSGSAPQLGQICGHEMGREMNAGGFIELTGPDVLIAAVPLHPDRLVERGYNQSRMLAQGIAETTGFELAPEDSFRRIRKTPHQAWLGRKERMSNIRGAFSAAPGVFSGRTVLIVDDVKTTGATLVSAAGAILSAGANKVYCACLTDAA